MNNKDKNYNYYYNLINCIVILLLSSYLFFFFFYNLNILDFIMIPIIEKLDILKWYITFILFIYDIYLIN